MPDAVIRDALPADAPEIARLLTLLGHASTTAEVEARWREWAEAGNVALVAEGTGGGGAIAGLATLHVTHVLHRPHAVGRVTALVVDERLRGGGIGRALVAAAEARLAAAGCGLVEITSNVKRTDAHAFYERIGYERTSVRLMKPL
jgi:GNAT superfamily N-acetyltransferase